jgi:hypothetical protein
MGRFNRLPLPPGGESGASGKSDKTTHPAGLGPVKNICSILWANFLPSPTQHRSRCARHAPPGSAKLLRNQAITDVGVPSHAFCRPVRAGSRTTQPGSGPPGAFFLRWALGLELLLPVQPVEWTRHLMQVQWLVGMAALNDVRSGRNGPLMVSANVQKTSGSGERCRFLRWLKVLFERIAGHSVALLQGHHPEALGTGPAHWQQNSTGMISPLLGG